MAPSGERVVRAVVFDAVGTLIYPEPSVAAAYAAVGRRYGSRKTQQEIQRAFHVALQSDDARDLVGDLATSEQNEERRWRRIVAAVLDDVSDPQQCFEELWGHFARAESWQLYDDANEVLNTLFERRIPVAVASNFDSRLEGICHGIPLLARCRPIVACSRIGFRKPHPAMFQAVTRFLNLPPSDLLHIGDDPVGDYQAARAAGWQSLLLRRKAHDLPHAPATETIQSLTALLAPGLLLRSSFGRS